MVKGKYRIYWFSIFLILLSFAFVITFDVYKALGTIITLDALDESAGDYTVTQYDGYSVISITQGGEYTLTQNDIDTAVKTNIIVESEEPVTILLDGVNIHAGDYEQKSVFNDHQMGTGAISIQGNTDCKIILADDTINTIVGRTFYNGGNTAVDNSFLHTAAISVENSIVDGVVRLASVTIEGESGLDSNGILNATGGRQAAAIGGNNDRLTGNITINSGVINATSGDFGAAIGDGDTVRTSNGGMLWTVGQTNSISKIVINGGEVWAIATTDTPGIGTADELISGINATADVWTGMEIEINGGSIVSVGGGEQYNPSSAIGAGSNTNLSSSNIVINIGTDENPTQIIAVTQTKQGSFPVSNVGGSSIPALSTESSASVLNIKFDSSKIASHLDFWYLVDPTYSTEPTTEFPNSILERMGDINVLGMAVVLPEGKYRVTQDTDGDGTDPDDPILADDLVVGGNGATTCEEQSDKTLICRYPLELRSPIDVVVFEKSPASFDVEVTKKSDGSTISYHWFMSSDEGNHWVSIDNETSSEYLIDETSLEMNGYLFRCDVTENINGEVSTLSSKEARLTVIELPRYDFKFNLFLDGNKFTDNNNEFDLYNSYGEKVIDLTNDDGVLKGDFKAGTYRLYIDGVDLGNDYVITETAANNEYDIIFYSVNLNVVSDNKKDSVTLNGETFKAGNHSKALILMEGKSFDASALVDVDSELIKFTINSDEQDINELVNGYSMNVNSKTDVVVEFELKDYQSEINVYLDNAIYTDITGSFELRNDNDTFELENTNGVLSGTITAGSYKLYRDNKVINENIVISSSVNNNRVDYYSVDLELSSTDAEDEVLINGKSYKASKDAVVIALKGDEVTVKAVPNAERKLVAYSVNNVEDSIEDLLKEDTLVINEKTELYVEFDVVLYDVTLNTYLDNEIFDANEAIYELYDESGRLVSQLTGGDGVYSDSLPKGKYYLYENSSDLNYEINVTKDSEYERHFYTVSLELVNPLGNNVGIGGNAYDSSFDKLLVYSAGDKISVEAYTDSVTEVVKYTVNGTDASFDDKVTVDKPIKLYVEFDYIDFDIKINVNLDDELFTDVDYEYSLYKDGTKVIDLTNTNGVLSGSVPVGEYEIYENGSTTNLLINVDSDSKEFEIDYYSVNVDIKSDVNTDAYVLDGTNYTTDKSIVVLNGSEVTIKAIPSDDRVLAEAQLDGGSLELDQVLSSYNFVVNSTTDVYLEFDYVTYDVDVNFYLDDAIYENLIGDFRVLDSDDKEVTNVYLTNGVVHFNGKADNYELYYDGKLVKEMAVISTNRSFEVDYYSVNLDFDKVFDTDMVEINSSCFGGDTAVNEIVVLAGEDVDLKAIPSDEVKVTEFTINGTAGNVNELLAGTKVNVTKKTNIVVKMDLVEYDFSLNTYLDEEVYTSNTNSYALYKDGNKVVDLNSNNGIYTGSVPADTYDLYINGNDSYNVVTVSDSINSYDLDYYSVSLEIKNPLNNSSVSVDGTSYDTSFSKGLVYLAGTDILVDFSADGDVIPVKYTVNDKNGEFGSFVTVNETINLYVEFDYVDIDVVINVMLDDKAYTDVNYNYSLYKDGTKYIDLTKNNGVLSGSVKSGKYEIYEGASTTRKYIEVSNTNKVFELNYYTVNVDIDSEVNTDSYMINGSTYNDDQSIISLEGKEVIVSATPSEGRKLVDYRIDNVTQEFANTGVTDSFVTSGTTVLYFEFDHITYDVDVEFHLDNSIYSSIIGEVYVLDSSDNKVSNVEFVDGVVHFNGKADNYELYSDDKLVKEMAVTSTNTSFEVDYYSVNLDFDKVLDTDLVEINTSCFSGDTAVNEIVVLAGEEISLKAIPSDEVKVTEFTINGTDSNVDELLDGMKVNVSQKTDVYIKMSTVEYDFSLNTYLDEETYTTNTNSYALYREGNKVVDLTNNNGIYTGSVHADNYKLYINGEDSNKEITITKTNNTYELNYYSVSLEIKNPLNNSVTVDGNSYTTGFNKELIYLADTKIDVDAVVDTETKVVKYIVNGTDSSFDDKVTIDEPIKLYVEFDYKEFDIKVNVKLDNEMYTDVDHEYSLYKDDIKVIDLTNNNGVLSGKVINGRYEIYEDGIATDKFIEVSSTSKEFELNYYSVNVQLNNLAGLDKAIINNVDYTSKDNEFILLEGKEIAIKAVPDTHREVRIFTINETDSDINSLLDGTSYTINEKTDIYIKFNIVEYSVLINILVDDVLDTEAPAIYSLYDLDGNKASNLSKENGVLSGSVGYGEYYIYSGTVNTNVKINITETDNEFDLLYYTVNLDIEPVNVLDYVTINGLEYTEDTVVKQIVVLKDEVVDVNVFASNDTEIYEFKVNGTDNELSFPKSIKVSTKTDLYVKYGNKKYDQVMNVYVDDVLIDDLSLVPDITLSKDDVIYDNESKLVNGNYEVLLDNESTGIYVSVISGKVDIYFYNLLLSGDNGIASLDGDGLYLKGTDVSVSAGLKSGYNFDGWYLTEQPYDTGLDIVINDIDARYELEAKTIALKPYEPVISPENLYYEYGYDGEKQIQLIVQPYQGTTINSYQWYKCEDDKCSSKVIIEGAVSKEYNPTDKNVGDYYYYCDVLITRDDNGEAINTGSVVKVVVSPITPVATLKDKVEYYTGSNIKANEVELDSIIENDKFNITYLYYLDEDYTIPTSRLNGGATVQGGEPAFVGVYYVKAVVDGNNNYYATVAYGKLTILESILPDVPKDDDVVVNPPTADNIMIIVLALASGAILIKGVPYLAKRRY